MKSAYSTLGIPGNASEEDIQQAYELSKRFYSKEKLIANPSLAERVNEIKEAYKILSTSDLRQLHDRKLSAAVTAIKTRAVYTPVDEESKSWGALKLMLIALIVMFAIGTYFYKVRADERKARFEQEIALKKQAEAAEAKAVQEQAAAEAERARRDALADRKEQQLRAENFIAGRQVQASQMLSETNQARQIQADRSAALQAERQRQHEAQQRAASDQRQLRNLCMQNYGRPNC